MQLSIIIPAYNEAAILPDTIANIREALASSKWSDKPCEIILCDNSSTDDTQQVAEQLGIQVVPEAERQISKARNTGAQQAQGQWLLFIDADTYPTAALMNDLWNTIQKGYYVGIGTTIKVQGGSKWNQLRMERLNPLMRWLNWCGGAFILCEKEAFEKIGGFSTDLYALEEIEFVIRLRRYARSVDSKFTVLYKHPAITSGRKGENTFSSFFTVTFSTTLSIIWLFLHLLLPKAIRFKGNPKFLGFWYNRRNTTK
ncbi:MAG: glycosyltransferase [Saprospiraceae bacterium]|nr:glycosyltransferase [Saprospiraceae bacterium]